MALLAEQQAEARRRADEEFEAVETGTAPLSDEELAAQDETEAQSAASDQAYQSESEPEREAPPDDDGHDADQPQSEAEEDNSEASLQEHDERFETSESFEDHASELQFAGEPASSEESMEQPDGEANAPAQAESGQPISAESEEGRAPRSQSLQASRPPQRWMRRRHYKIQEVIKRRQVMLVQVVKEERGNKGAALTTYLSLAGRYCVLMPNTPRGGGISRKITNAADRTRLKSAASALELPEGMGLIIRTAGESRTKLEIKRDYEYLLRMWDTIRELTLKSNAPACVYEEGDLIKRAIRDLYNKDVSEIVVEGDDGYRNAKDFMRMLMPSHAKNVKPYKDAIPLFQRHHIEAQLDAMFSPTVTLRSGGYIVINQTEALVSIDVNSGRATREHSIEETAYKTNLEAAEEVARQLRLRDLAGLIVIDFIDMEDQRNDRNVEKRLRDCVKNDRARVQIGKISQFGLLEMSRQRLRAGVIAGSTVPCPHCGGQGIVRSVESTALRLLRALDEEGQRRRSSAVVAHAASDVSLYTLNQKRRELARIENDYGMVVTFEPKADVLAGTFDLERSALPAPQPQAKPVVSVEMGIATPTDTFEPIEAEEEAPEEVAAPPSGSPPQQPGSSRKRRRRRRGRDHNRPPTLQEPIPAVDAQAESSDHAADAPTPATPSGNGESGGPTPAPGTGSSRRRRRRRRGPRENNAGSPMPSGDAPRAEHGASQSHSRTGGDSNGYAREPLTIAPPLSPEPAVAPNAPSAPVWSFSHDVASRPSPVAHKPVETPAPQAMEAAKPVPFAAKEPEIETPPPSNESNEPAQPQRKGWWQRPFRVRD
jgi:ribonuclease E